MKSTLVYAALLAILLLPRPATAEPFVRGSEPPVYLQLAVFDPMQLFPSYRDVVGLRLSLLYGRSSSIVGLDLGVAGEAEYASGLQIAVIKQSVGNFGAGIQIAAGMNEVYDSMTGIQIGSINVAGSVHGIQLGLIFNQAMDVRGMQIGLINMCNTMYGIQIGLLNTIQSHQMPFFPIINGSF